MSTTQRLQREWEKVLESFEGDMRPILRKQFLCSADCVDNSNLDARGVQNCLQACGAQVERVSRGFEGESQRFQQRINICQQECQRVAGDLASTGADQATVQASFDGCVEKCAESGLGQLEALQQRMRDILKQSS